MFSQKESKNYFTKRDVPAVIALALGLVLAVLTFILMQKLEFKSLRNQFIYDTQKYSIALEKSIEANLNSLYAVEGLFASSQKVTRDRFRTFATNMLMHSQGVHALRWVPRVAGPDRKKYEAAAIRDGHSNFHFTQLNEQKQPVTAGIRDEYFPVYFVETAGGNESTLGFDIGASRNGRASLEKARDTGEPVATRRIRLLLEGDTRFAFLVFQPIYRNGSRHDTIQGRRNNLLGFASGVFRLEDMVNTALKGTNLSGIEISLLDEEAAPERRLLYSNVSEENSAANALTHTTTVTVADRTWTVKFHSTRDYLSSHRSRYSWAVLAAVLVSIALLALYILNMKRHAFEMERSNNTIATVLNSINSAIAIVDSKDMKIAACNKIFVRESGTNEDDIIGKRCDQIAHTKLLPCDRHCEQCPLMIAKQTGGNALRDTILRDSDGAERYLEMTAFPIRNDTGKVTQIVHTAQDITDRKHAELARLHEQQARRMSAERQVVETQLRMLQAQIEPHFLFNTLANAISLIDTNGQSAKEMLRHLTGCLRLSLERSREETSTLAREFEMLKAYLSIFKIRLGSRLDFALNIPEELMELPLPPMLLQPLVENAIKHGIEPKIDGGRITIKAEKSDGIIRLTVSDTGLGFNDQRHDHGFGLENVASRLRALYGDRARLILEENTPTGASATIEVPL